MTLLFQEKSVFIVIFAGVAAAFPLMPLGLAWLWRRFFQPPKPGVIKNATYECGVDVFTSTFDDRKDDDTRKCEMQICVDCVRQLAKLL